MLCSCFLFFLCFVNPTHLEPVDPSAKHRFVCLSCLVSWGPSFHFLVASSLSPVSDDHLRGAMHIPSSPFLFKSPISAHPRPMHGRHPHLSSPSPLSPSNRHTRLHKDSQSHPSARMESKHACGPSLHLLAVRTTSARRLLASPVAITRTSHLDGPHLLVAAEPPPTAPLSILPPVVKAPSEDDVAFGEAS